VPRLSAEARSAEMWRAGEALPPAPKYLCEDASGLWAEVVASKPAGYFDPASLCLLEVFCSAAAILRQMSARMNALDPKDREYGRLVRLSATMSGTLSTMATRLRLCQSSRLRHEDGRLNERVAPRGSLLGLQREN
jgi:phage terminase small subunit